MAVRSLGQLRLDLVARIGGFTGPLDKASRAAKKDMGDIAQSVRRAAGAVTATAGAATAAGGALVTMTKYAADNARELRSQAQVANTSVEELQRLSYGSQTVGIEQEKLSDILKDVNDRVGDFLDEGAGEMSRFFEHIAPQVGVTAEQFRNLSGPQALQLYYDSLQKANLSQAEMTTYMERISNDATALIPLLRDGGARFSEMAEEADQLGIVLSDLDIAQLEDFGEQFDRISGILSNMGNVVAGELSPYLSVMSDRLVENAKNTHDVGEAFSTTLRTIVEGTAPVLDVLDKVLLATKALRTFAYTMGQAYTTVFAEIIDAGTKALDFVAGGLNEVIEGFNNLPGVDVPLISSFNESGYAQGVREMRDTVAAFAAESREELVEAFSAPPPSEGILAYLDEVDAKREEIEANLGRGGSGIFKTLEQWMLKPPASGSGGGDDSATESETDAIQRQIDALKRQAATLGMTEEEQQLYELAADGATEAQLAQARAAQEAISSYEDQQQALSDYRQMVESLRTPEEQLNDQLQRRLDLLKQAEVSPEERQKLLPRIVDEGFSEAPEYEGLDATVGGPSSELDKIDSAEERLQEWYDTQLEQLATYREQRAELEETWNAQERALKQTHEDELARIESARQYAQLAATESLFGDMADITRTFAGEQSDIYKAMFAAEKAYSVASILLSSKDAIADAWNSATFPANLPAVAMVTAETGALAAAADAITLSGMAHDGIDRVPQEGTWLLDKGERVLTAEQADRSDKVDRAIASIAEGQRSAGQGALPGEGELPPIYVDARQSSDPVAMEQAARRGAEEGYRKVFEDVATNGAIRRALGA